ncbi:Peptidoglycan/LPS O-acetylase OafA/YrhL, contains acyltransferase and SGNH-hydrolase domains [Filimonas lacunae]|uniref:Peptidoglycan/LPS O-acetylase OafA/YrhL, contains acyltransferase and SGNH-hydrolase domains n=1 Tax=Filimonas lacunae TaxID=477680 RepID=A0A173MEX5_9BACT|nr:acyltransferase [Filimonas lacunae]BAV06152.1 acyltransferase [Filimonas lacunae]SIT24939.1 Peptidoglycan/LPS O-acetylase OafA/YrhL, contains acyltransferase and SGNH-hydrolase domains [Filimonas lacunae]
MITNGLATKPHYPVLDGLRGVAAILVVVFHICEAHATSHIDQVINHGYLAVDFFFLLSGFVMGYAYDDRWHKLTIGSFFKRRLIRLQPMVVMGMLVGAVCFYFSGSAAFPLIHTVLVWKLLLVMLIGCTLIPIPISMDIRGWQEMHPLDGPGWSLFFEYVVNILYALGLRKLSKTALSILVIIAGGVLIHYAVTSKTGDVIGGWSLNEEQLRIGCTRVLFPFFGGLLLSRITRPVERKHAFLISSVLLIIVLAMPRIGGFEHLWMNGLYDSLSIILLFPLIVYVGAGGRQSGQPSKLCKWLGDLSYPLYITHYPFIYIYTGWVSNHKGIAVTEALPNALLTFAGTILVGYAALKWYDEPVRAWLTKKSK